MSADIVAARRSLANAMTRPTLAGLLDRGRIVLEAPSKFQASAIADRQIAWCANPRCWICDTPTPSPEESAYLKTPVHGRRVTCRTRCFAIAIARVNPTFDRATAMRHAEG